MTGVAPGVAHRPGAISHARGIRLADRGLPTADHRALGIARLARLVRSDARLPVSSLAPLAAVLGHAEAPGIVRGTAAHALRDQAKGWSHAIATAFFAIAADALWANRDPAAAPLIEKMRESAAIVLTALNNRLPEDAVALQRDARLQ